MRIGLSPMISSQYIDTLHSAAKEARNPLQIWVETGHSIELLNALQNGLLDLALVHSQPHSGILSAQRIASNSFFIAFDRKHPLANNREVSLNQLVEFPWVFFSRTESSLLYDDVMTHFQDSERKPHIRHRIGHHEQAALELVRDSIAAWLTPGSAEVALSRGLVCIPLAEPKIVLETHIVTLGSNRSPVLSEFVRRFVKLVEAHGLPLQMPLPIPWSANSNAGQV